MTCFWTNLRHAETACSEDFVSVVGPNVYSGRLISAPQYTGEIFYSDDNGDTWTLAYTSIDVPTFTNFTTIGDSVVAVTNTNYAASSTDGGTNWTEYASVLPSGYTWRCATDGTEVMAVGAGAGGVSVQISTDLGATWTTKTTPTGWTTNVIICGPVWTGSSWVMLDGFNNKWAVSTDSGATWSTGSMPSSGLWSQLAWSGTQLAASMYSRFATSANGSTWADNNIGDGFYGGAMLYGGGNFATTMATTSTAGRMSGDDGATWSSITLPYSAYFRDGTYNGSVYVFVGFDGVYSLARSADLNSWASVAVLGTPALRTIAHIV